MVVIAVVASTITNPSVGTSEALKLLTSIFNSPLLAQLPTVIFEPASMVIVSLVFNVRAPVVISWLLFESFTFLPIPATLKSNDAPFSTALSRVISDCALAGIVEGL